LARSSPRLVGVYSNKIVSQMVIPTRRCSS
jgi:hypothetical protein